MRGVESGVEKTPTESRFSSKFSLVSPSCNWPRFSDWTNAGSAIDQVLTSTRALSAKSRASSEQEMSVRFRLCGLVMSIRGDATESLGLSNCLLDTIERLG